MHKLVKALIVVAMMKAYCHETYNRQEMIDNQLKLIDVFNKYRLPVILINMDPKRPRTNPCMLRLFGELHPDFSRRELIPEIKGCKHSVLITKTEYSSFYRTGLERYCRNNGIDELYFTGVNSDVCVFFSAVDAMYRRIQPYLVTDAASTDKKSFHTRTCRLFESAIGPLITTEELIDELEFLALNRRL